MAKNKGTVLVTCNVKTTLNLSDLNDLQGDLKERSPAAMVKLKKSILKHGFFAPMFIWENPQDAKIYLLDGHSRREVLNDLKAEGYTLPQIPVVYIDATSEADAKEKLLAISSQYGKVTKEGAENFLASFEFDSSLFEIVDVIIPPVDLKTITDLGPIAKDVTTVKEHLRAVGEGEEFNEVDMPDLQNGGEPQLKQITFILHKDQLEAMKEAIKLSKAQGEFVGTGNENSNGNAIARIVEHYLSCLDS